MASNKILQVGSSSKIRYHTIHGDWVHFVLYPEGKWNDIHHNPAVFPATQEWYDKLVNSEPVHASAFEHCATPIPYGDDLTNFQGITHWLDVSETDDFIPCSGNFTNWVQYRQLIPNHDCKEYKAIK